MACAFNLSNYDWMSRRPKGGQANNIKMQQNAAKSHQNLYPLHDQKSVDNLTYLYNRKPSVHFSEEGSKKSDNSE